MSWGHKGGVEVEFYSFFNIVVRRSGWLKPRPGRFTLGNDPVPIVQEAGAPGLVWTGVKILAPLRFVPLAASRCSHYAVRLHDHFIFIILEYDVLKWILQQEIIK